MNQLSPANWAEGAAIADINKDGYKDVILLTNSGYSNYTEFIEVFRYLGNGRFSPPSITKLGFNYSSGPLAVGDLNGDGAADILYGGTTSVSYLLNDGAGNFSLKQTLNLSQAPGYVKAINIGDLNHDGLNDIIVGNSESISILRNNKGSFPSYMHRDDLGASSIDLADFDRDGSLDIVALGDTTSYAVPMLNKLAQTKGDDGKNLNPNSFVLVDDYEFTFGPTLGDAKAFSRNGLANARIQLSGTPGKFTTVSDDNGFFQFAGIPNGTYNVVATARGKKIKSVTPTLVVSGPVLNLRISSRKDFLPSNLTPSQTAGASRDPAFGAQWGFNNTGQDGGVADVDIDVPEAWSVTRGDSNLIVAVLDTGVDVNHPDLAANIYKNPGEIPNNNIDDDGDGLVDDVSGWNFADNNKDARPRLAGDYHGTHVAGTIAASADNNIGVAGVAPNVKILPVRVLGDGGSGSTADIIKGMEYVATLKRRGVNIRVVNASLGGHQDSCDPATLSALQTLEQVGILFVVSAGNDGQDIGQHPMFPAACPVASLVSVANVTRTGALAESSNYNSSLVQVAAPGTEIWSTTAFPWSDDATTGYMTLTGTSMAAPHVAGTAALILSKNPALTPKQVKQILMDSSKPLSALQGKVSSGGIISAARALQHPLIRTVTATNPGTGAISVPSGVIASKGGKLKLSVAFPKDGKVGVQSFLLASKMKNIKANAKVSTKKGQKIVSGKVTIPANKTKKMITYKITMEYHTKSGKLKKLKLGSVQVKPAK